MSWKRSNPNCNGNRRDEVALTTTCNKNVKFTIIKVRTSCHVGYFYHSENLNWAAQNLRLGRELDITVSNIDKFSFLFYNQHAVNWWPVVVAF